MYCSEPKKNSPYCTPIYQDGVLFTFGFNRLAAFKIYFSSKLKTRPTITNMDAPIFQKGNGSFNIRAALTKPITGIKSVNGTTTAVA
jgi:hypothetical protein